MYCVIPSKRYYAFGKNELPVAKFVLYIGIGVRIIKRVIWVIKLNSSSSFFPYIRIIPQKQFRIITSKGYNALLIELIINT